MNLENCTKCNVRIKNKNLGMEIKDGITCKKCYFEHLDKLIKEFNELRKSSEFEDILVLRKKKFRLDEEMGYWHDLDGYTVGLTEYMDDTKEELQKQILDELLSLVEDREETRDEIKERTKLQKDILEQIRKIKIEW